MPKAQVPMDELEALIVQAVRRRDHCQGFQSVELLATTDGPEGNWRVGKADYGSSELQACDHALGEVLPQMQRDYDLSSQAVG